NTPYQISNGLYPEGLQTQAQEAMTRLTPAEFTFTQHVLDNYNNGAPEANPVDVGAMKLMPGTEIYRAPMKGAIDHVVDKSHYEGWFFPRVLLVNGQSWGVISKVVNGKDWNLATDPRDNLWVKLSQAQSVPGFKHLAPLDPSTMYTGPKLWKLPPVYATKPDGKGNLEISQEHPQELNNDSGVTLTYCTTGEIKQLRYLSPDGTLTGPNRIVFAPTKRQIKYQRAQATAGAYGANND